MHVKDCQLKTPASSLCNGVFVTRRPGVCGYDQIFLAGGVPAIGEGRVLCVNSQESGGALQIVTVKGNPPILELLYTSV